MGGLQEWLWGTSGSIEDSSNKVLRVFYILIMLIDCGSILAVLAVIPTVFAILFEMWFMCLFLVKC